MFESESRLRGDVLGLLDALRALAGGRYAALFDAKGVILESPAAGEPREWILRRFLDTKAPRLLEIPQALHEGGEMQDLFAEFEEDEFFLAFVNGKVGVLAVCREAKRVEQESAALLKALCDRLLRLNPAWRLDRKGRGFLAGRPRLDTISIGRAEE